MIRSSLILYALALAGAVGATSCAKSPQVARPDEPPQATEKKGLVFGRIQVNNDFMDLTPRGCGVTFVNKDGQSEMIKLEASGWVFWGLPLGSTRISEAVCYDPVRGIRLLIGGFEKNLSFQVMGEGQITYFGDVQIKVTTIGDVERALEWGEKSIGTSGVIATRNHLPEALDQYRKRHGQDGPLLTPVVWFLSDETTLPKKPPPNEGAGFALDDDIENTERRCTGAKNVWKAGPGGTFLCSGAAADLGMPMTVEFAECDGTICLIVVDASADAARFRELFQRYGKLAERLTKEFGEPSKRSVERLDDCTERIEDCLAVGRVKAEAVWKWPDWRFVSLRLDGGLPEEMPTLTLKYGLEAVTRQSGRNPVKKRGFGH